MNTSETLSEKVLRNPAKASLQELSSAISAIATQSMLDAEKQGLKNAAKRFEGVGTIEDEISNRFKKLEERAKTAEKSLEEANRTIEILRQSRHAALLI